MTKTATFSRMRIRSIWALLILALMPAGFAPRPVAAQARPAARWVPLLGHRTTAAAAARDQGRVAPSQPIRLTFALALRDQQGLETLLHRLYDPQDPLYRHFLTPAQFTARFCPAPAEYAAVAAFARAAGLTITATTPNRLLLTVEAPSAAVESAFGVHLHRLQDAQGRQFHAPNAEPAVPVTLAPLLCGVVGLDNSAVWHTHFQQLPASLIPVLRRPAARPGQGEAPAPEVSSAALLPLSGTGPNGGLAPSDIKTAYNLNGVALSGSGQPMALMELDGYVPSDIANYESYFGLPSVTLQNVLVDGGSGALGGGQAEVTLDIELQAALAPGTSSKPNTILVYEAPNTDQGVVDTYNRIATDNKAKQISTSWGLDEQDWASASVYAGQPQVLTPVLQAEYNIFQQMAAQGQTIFAAAGDSGAYDGARDPKTLSPILSVDDPASQPYVTGVGGTSLATNGAGGTYGSETTWNNGSGSAGGGGISAIWAIPSWQQKLSAQNQSVFVGSAGSKGSATMRNVPDVSLDSNPYTGYAIYVAGSWTVYGGTSCAAPLWAAYTALVNQQRQANGSGVLGFANPIFYAAAQGPYGSIDFHDIADGSTNLFYPAITGYDDATGWGSFSGANLLADLAPPPPTSLTATAKSTTQISLGWNAVPNAVGYTVSRSGTHGGPYTQVGSTNGATTFSDAGLASGTTYFYVVTASTSAEISAASNEASAVTGIPAQNAPPAPTGLAAVPGNGYITLSWQPVAGATGYALYRGAGAGGEGATPYRTGLAAAAFTDTGLTDGTAYFYQVTAVGTAGESARSAEAAATPFSVPTGLDLGFEAPVVGSGSGAYQYGPSGAPWAFVGGAGIAGPGSAFGNPTAPEGSQAAFIQDTGTISQALPGFQSGIQYTLTLAVAQRAYNGVNTQSVQVRLDGQAIGTLTPIGTTYRDYAVGPFTTTNGAHSLTFAGLNPNGGDNTAFLDNIRISGSGTGSGAPPAPTGLTASAGDSQVTLSWQPVAGATGYALYRGASAGGEGATPYRTGLAAAAFTDTGLTDGTAYFYQVTAVGTAGESARSTEAAATPTSTQAVYRLYNPSSGNHFYTANPAEESAVVSSGGYSLEGIIGYAPMATSGTAPVYRLYIPSTGDHFYTVSAGERDSVAAAGWPNEGISWQVFTSPGTGLLPLFRLYVPSQARHFYTTSQSEHDALIASGAWNDEGIMGYLKSSP